MTSLRSSETNVVSALWNLHMGLSPNWALVVHFCSRTYHFVFHPFCTNWKIFGPSPWWNLGDISFKIQSIVPDLTDQWKENSIWHIIFTKPEKNNSTITLHCSLKYLNWFTILARFSALTFCDDASRTPRVFSVRLRMVLEAFAWQYFRTFFTVEGRVWLQVSHGPGIPWCLCVYQNRFHFLRDKNVFKTHISNFPRHSGSLWLALMVVIFKHSEFYMYQPGYESTQRCLSRGYILRTIHVSVQYFHGTLYIPLILPVLVMN